MYPFPALDAPYAGKLNVFDGAKANCAWKLFAFNDSPNGMDAGGIEQGWKVTVKAKVRR